MTPALLRQQKLAAQLAATEPKVRASYVSTYIPRECGIATYTRAITKAINILNPYYLADIIAIDDEHSGGEHRTYPWEVKYKIDQEDLSTWLKAADYINQSSADVVVLQHEFGIFGGTQGEYVLPFMERITKPIIICFHTVLQKPEPKMVKIVKEMSKKAAALIVIVEAAGKLLSEYYGVDPNKIVTIPHGVPDIPFGPSAPYKKKLGYANSTIISSFGLFSRSKGYEYAIEALPAVIKNNPQTKLLLLGETHPVVLRQEGEIYRESLQELIKKLGLEDHVEFVNRYLTLDEIVSYLRATDIYVTPYPNLDQVSSGTLSYAVSAGRPCVSTPYVYAKEVLADGRGVICKPLDNRDLAKKINQLLSDPEGTQKMSQRAYAYGRSMIWPNVALRHLELFEIVAKEHEK